LKEFSWPLLFIAKWSADLEKQVREALWTIRSGQVILVVIRVIAMR